MGDFEDAGPRRRRRRHSGDEEEPPRRRSRSDDDSEDNEPPRRRRRERDDGVVEKPSRRTSRAYVHDDCGEETEISGDDFTRLANPFAWVGQTYCASCEKYAGLRRFTWADTDEDLVSYRRRLRRRAPLSLKLWCWFFGPALGALLGALIGMLLSPNDRTRGVIVGGVCGGAFFGFFLVQYVSKWFWRIDYRQKT